MSVERDRTTLVAFVAGAVLAGGNAVAIRFSNRELEPLWGAALRFLFAAVVLFALTAALRLALPRGRAFAGAVAFGTVQFAATFGLFYYALVELRAGFGQIVLALVPLLTLLIAIAERQESFRLDALVGGAVSLVGVVFMTRGALPDAVPALSLLAMFGSAACFAQAAVLVRLLPAVHPVTMNAVGMATGAVVLFAAALIAGEELAAPADGATWSALAYVATFGSVGVFLLYLYVLGRWIASRAAYSFVLIPIVAVILSAWLDNEPVGVALLLGGGLVLVGVYLGALRTSTGGRGTS